MVARCTPNAKDKVQFFAPVDITTKLVKGKGVKMPTNKFELQGRVGYIDIQYKDKNDKLTVYTTINLGVKKAEGLNSNDEKNWDNFFITFFNTEKRNTAEILAERVQKGDYIRVAGKLSENKFKPEGQEKETSITQLIGYGFKKQKYDEMQQEWVDVD